MVKKEEREDQIDPFDSVGGIAKKVFKYVFILIIALIIIFGCFYTVGAGERAVLITLGKASDTVSDPGLHFKLPLIQHAVKMSVQTLRYEGSASAASSDLQTVDTKVVVNYHLQPESVPRIYREIGTDYVSTVIAPLEQEVVKATTAKFTAEQLVTKREEVRLDMKDVLHQRLSDRGFVVEEVSIVNFSFSPSFEQAIEAKVTAEQDALAAKNKLAQVEYEKQQRITQAEGEAEAIKIQAAAVQAQGGKDYVELQRINKWNGVGPTTVIGASSSTLVEIPTASKA